EEDGRQVFATFLLLAPGQTMETSLSYRLPAVVIQAGETAGTLGYTLTVQKQPGTSAVPLRVFVILPMAAKLRHTQPRPAVIGPHTLTYELTLTADQFLCVEWTVPGPGAGL
ncbi:MAG: hypothetical protein ACUVWB_03690, partial [Anaerolineae bacterium]